MGDNSSHTAVRCCYYEKETREKTMVLGTTNDCPELPGWKRISVVDGAIIKFDSPQGIDVEFFRGEPVQGEFCAILCRNLCAAIFE